ncbi:hypothetical protein [Streptomyces zhihengii]|uniref:Integral membrane protein n=1 Tax=Streptomyces zhihengii TaxID=1818004 RepID=A0ABS2V3N8_9ACTN|nr:hypothetical protein [Streptomyces zhihengii]MBM9624451.1 hypothetical protein [Streptomyces zhihengii]
MTTQQPSRALAREAAGLLMTATGAFGALVALGALHWALGAAAFGATITFLGLSYKPRTGAPRWTLRLRAAVGVGYGFVTGGAFTISPALGWLSIAGAVAGAGWWLATGSEGA